MTLGGSWSSGQSRSWKRHAAGAAVVLEPGHIPLCSLRPVTSSLPPRPLTALTTSPRACGASSSISLSEPMPGTTAPYSHLVPFPPHLTVPTVPGALRPCPTPAWSSRPLSHTLPRSPGLCPTTTRVAACSLPRCPSRRTDPPSNCPPQL